MDYPLQAFHLDQFRLPIPLQGPGDQAILGGDRLEPPPGQFRLVPRPLPHQLPLAIGPPRLLGDLVDGRHRHLQLGRTHGLEEDAGHRLIDPIAAERPPGLLSALLMKPIAFVQRDLAVVHVTDRHASPTPPAQDQAPEQRRPFSECPASLLMVDGAILEEPPLIPLELFPGDVAGVVVVEHERPILGDEAARPPLDPPLLAGQDDVAGPGPSIDIGARVGRVVEDGQDTPVVQGPPVQLAVAAASVMATGKVELILGEILDHAERVPDAFEGVEDQTQRLLHLLVGIEDGLAVGVVGQPGGKSAAELAGPGLLQLAPPEPRSEPVQLGGAHGPFYLIGVIMGPDERGGSASLVARDMPWLAEALREGATGGVDVEGSRLNPTEPGR